MNKKLLLKFAVGILITIFTLVGYSINIAKGEIGSIEFNSKRNFIIVQNTLLIENIDI